MSIQDTTLVIIDCVNAQKALKVLEHNSIFFNFAKVKLLTSENITTPNNIECVVIPKLDFYSYNHFTLFHLHQYIDTQYVLSVQTDGYIINPHLISDAFFEYDYIGAPWTVADLHISWADSQLDDFAKLNYYPNRVGNSGFCLRSKKFLLETSTLTQQYKQHKTARHDDVYSCCIQYKTLLNRGVKFADLKTAASFSVEDVIPEYPNKPGKIFGFHGSRMLNYLTLYYPHLIC